MRHQCFRRNEAPTVVSIVAQQARLKLTEGEDIQSFFIRAQEVDIPLQAGESLNPAIFNAMILNGLPEQCEHFIVQESFNQSGDYTELRKTLLNYSIGKEQRLGLSASQGMWQCQLSHSLGRLEAKTIRRAVEGLSLVISVVKQGI